MIVNVIKNSILISSETIPLAIKADLNFERVKDTEDFLGDIGIIPIFSIYVVGIDGSEECKNQYKDFYKEILIVMGILFKESHYINTFESVEKIYCLKESMLETNEAIKLPYLTTLKLFKD